MKDEREFGITVGDSSGLPVYVTDVERTLIDAIRMPGSAAVSQRPCLTGVLATMRRWRSS